MLGVEARLDPFHDGQRAGIDGRPRIVGAIGAVELMRRVKARFDPARVCNPGVFVGGI